MPLEPLALILAQTGVAWGVTVMVAVRVGTSVLVADGRWLGVAGAWVTAVTGSRALPVVNAAGEGVEDGSGAGWVREDGIALTGAGWAAEGLTCKKRNNPP